MKDVKKSGLATALKAEKQTVIPHLIVEARAGTGKTTTLVEGLRIVRGFGSKLTPSPQQAAVWESMALSKDAQSICFVAFNKAIAVELQNRVPQGCDAMTMHSMGSRAVRAVFTLKPGNDAINKGRVQDIISEITGTDLWQLRRSQPVLLKGVEDLVGLCKGNLLVCPTKLDEEEAAEWWDNQLDILTSTYDVELNGKKLEVYALVPKVLKRCLDVAKDRCIDFNDMIWIPIVLDLPIRQYDLLLVDEAQDLNRCQQALAKRAGRRLILCGDPKQAIYGFTGADGESMERMFRELDATPRGCELLPLTVTRRCGKAIVAEAQKYVPDFEAFATNPIGKIERARYDTPGPAPRVTKCPDSKDGMHSYTVDLEYDATGRTINCEHCGALPPAGVGNYRDEVKGGDMVLCRVNAPLVSQCFKFLKAGRKANIQGRDIGTGLVKLVERLEKKMEGVGITGFIMALNQWLHDEEGKELAKRQPSDSKLAALHDKHDCLLCFCDDQKTVADVIQRINSVFTDDRESVGIRLSSIHKAKGLEASRVFFLRPKGAECPHPMAKSKMAKEQEHNLIYVAITRAIEVLFYVS